MAIRKSSNSGIPFGNTANRPANPAVGQPYFNGQVGRLELYTGTGWQNIVQETPGVASATGHYYQSDNYGIFTISGTNFVDGGIAYAVGTNGVEYQAQTTTYNSIVQMTATFANLSAAYEPYDIKIVNPSNLFGLLPDAFYINESPIWSTTSGSLGNIITGQSVNIQLAATDSESNALTYTLSSGSLPSGLSLSSSGLISGTASGSTTQLYNFTIAASDGYNAAVTRSFSMAYTAVAVISGGTLTSDSTYYYRTFTENGTLQISNIPQSVDYLLVAGGAGAGYSNGSAGGGAGGYLSGSTQVSTGSYSIVIGSGGAGSSSQTTKGGNGVNSTALGLTSIGGGGSGSEGSSTDRNGNSGGSGGGGVRGGSGASGTPGQGNAGGSNVNDGSPHYSGGGGGGAGAAGTNGSAGTIGVGGNGLQWVNGVYYAGGGGGSGYNGGNGSTSGGEGGLGGGAQGGISPADGRSRNGSANTGGGGAGSGTVDRSAYSGNGGSGIFIIRYTKASVGG